MFRQSFLLALILNFYYFLLQLFTLELYLRGRPDALVRNQVTNITKLNLWDSTFAYFGLLCRPCLPGRTSP